MSGLSSQCRASLSSLPQRLRSWPCPATSRFACARRRSGQPSRPRRPARLSGGALSALGSATIRELGWGLRDVSREVKHWRGRAERIPDEALRQDALAAIDRKRANIDGAALFWTLPRVRSPALLR